MNKDPISVTHPELASEWSERNASLTPDMVTYGSHDKIWWKGKCGHEWKATAGNRVRGSGCPYCTSRTVLPGFNDFATVHPELLHECSEKNAPLTPDMFRPSSNKKVIWHGACDHEWTASFNCRSQGHSCPICANIVILPGFNDLSSKYPELAKDWSNRNLPVTPDKIYYKTRKKFWWKCPVCRNEYLRSPELRIRYDSSCPYCNGSKLIIGHNDLSITHPQLIQEWDYEKNDGLTPDRYMFTSKKYIFWKCKYGHSYGLQIHERTKLGKSCNICEAEYKVLVPFLLVIRYMSLAGYKASIGYKKDGINTEICYEELGIAFEHEFFSAHSKAVQQEKKQRLLQNGICLEILSKSVDFGDTLEHVRNLIIKYEVPIKCCPTEKDVRNDFFRAKDSMFSEKKDKENMQESENETMNEEMKLLLKLLLAQEKETEAGQKRPSRKKLAPEPTSGMDFPPEEKPLPHTDKEFRENDFENSRREMYPDHESNVSSLKGVPIWEKYALTVPEAAAYFHIGETRLRKLVKKDRYANYLIWNGGRVFIKRKLFEEYLDGENELL